MNHIVGTFERWYNMDKDKKDFIEENARMAISKEPKTIIRDNKTQEHKQKVSITIKDVTKRHDKLLKKLAE